MRAVVQRVREARVIVDARIVGSIGPGLLVLAGVSPADADADRDWLSRKIVTLRIFDDDAGVMNRSITEVGGEILAVSQFTLYASTRKGARPSYSAAAHAFNVDAVVTTSSMRTTCAPRKIARLGPDARKAPETFRTRSRGLRRVCDGVWRTRSMTSFHTGTDQSGASAHASSSL